MTRTHILVSALIAIAVIVLGLALSNALNKGPHDPAALLDANIILLPQSRAIPDITLTNQDGQPQALSSLKGKWTLLFFGYTFCPDICPTTMAQLKQINEQLPQETRERMQVVLVTVDPHRDTPERLKQYVGFFSPDFLAMTGDMKDIQTLSNATGIPFIPGDTRQEHYTVDHSGNLAIIDPKGRQLGFIRAPFETGKLVEHLPGLLTTGE